jgi:hypothetical protein
MVSFTLRPLYSLGNEASIRILYEAGRDGEKSLPQLTTARHRLSYPGSLNCIIIYQGLTFTLLGGGGTSGNNAGTRWVEHWVGHRASQDTVAKRNIPAPCQNGTACCAGRGPACKVFTSFQKHCRVSVSCRHMLPGVQLCVVMLFPKFAKI